MPRTETITARTMTAFITVNARSRARSSSWPVSKKLMATAKPAAAKAGPLSSPISMAPRKVIGAARHEISRPGTMMPRMSVPSPRACSRMIGSRSHVVMKVEAMVPKPKPST